MGCVLTAGQGQAPARQAAIAAGCPVATGAITLNKVCGSGMRAVMIAANDLRCGDFKYVVAGGMESMSQAPYLAAGVRDGLRLGHGKLIDSMVHDGLWDPYGDLHMGSCAEICAAEYKFSREEQDAYALESYRRAREASEKGLVRRGDRPRPRSRGKKGRPVVVDRDEEPFKVDLAKIATLRPAFQKDGTVTAGNASKINDGAAALVLTTAAEAARRGLKPLARIVAHATHRPEAGVVHHRAGGGHPPGARAGRAEGGRHRSLGDQRGVRGGGPGLPCATSSSPADRVNVRGGAVALGHPIGASGARILVTLLHAMRERGARLGCAAICIGGGEATAMIVERVD